MAIKDECIKCGKAFDYGEVIIGKKTKKGNIWFCMDCIGTFEDKNKYTKKDNNWMVKEYGKENTIYQSSEKDGQSRIEKINRVLEDEEEPALIITTQGTLTRKLDLNDEINILIGAIKDVVRDIKENHKEENIFNNFIDKHIYISNKGYKGHKGEKDMFVVQIEDDQDIIGFSISKEYRDRFRFNYDDIIKEIEEPKEQEEMEFEDYLEAMRKILDVDGRQKKQLKFTKFTF